ncbi:helix-turn-helix transcriptional regulator [Desertimonas flava]|uniref:helix-turn-helix transcriptional regulator n=1 Tax=Desertimonas flava TaxID=2064846 RepID=UPI000E353CB7|nr:LuxR family transcriptional regulator [Desertimonas flava]
MLGYEPGPPVLLGRSNEFDVFDRLLDDIRQDRSRVLVLRGEAGIGKSALLDHLANGAGDCRVLRTAGAEWEMELAFAGLHQLCLPMLDHLDALPRPQQDALGTAFGIVAGDAPDRFLVGLAVLSLLAASAEHIPLLCLIDDAHWLDHVSAQVLAFVARRLLAESVALVFAVRDPSDAVEFDGLPQRTIGPLGSADARALLESASPGRLDERVRDRIVAETRGNPLALLELPRGLSAAELAGGFALPDARPLSSQIEQAFVRRVQVLPPDVQRLLLVAAAEPIGDHALLRRAATRLGIGPDTELAAEGAGLIEFGAHVRFRHPLVRSAAYRSGSAADRQQIHLALAEATDADHAPDRRAWHRAHAAVAPDESVAADLEHSAGRAQRRGGVAAAAAFLERAAELTADPGRRAGRILAAAQAKLDAGAFDAADALLTAADIVDLDDHQRARAALLRAEIVYSRQRGTDAPPLLLDAATRLDDLADPLARGTYLEALTAAIFAGRAAVYPTVHDVAGAVRRAAARPAMPPTVVDALLDAMAARFTDGYAAAAPELRAALESFRANFDGDAGRSFGLAWLLAGELWDDQLWEELSTRAIKLARDAGTFGRLPLALMYRASVHVHAAEFDAADGLIEESDAITAAIDTAPLKYTTGLLAAWRGNESFSSSLTAAAVADANTRGEGRAFGLGGYFDAVLYNGLGRYDAALLGARTACAFDDFGVRGFALAELVEAGVHGGERTEASEALEELEDRTIAAGTEWSLGVLARSRAMMASGSDADELFTDAVERLGRTRIKLDLARAHLLYGEWLRREGRRVDARDQLRSADEIFSRAGAEAFAERARRELRATGETARKRSVSTRIQLTGQEAQIARLTAAGLTNPEIGSQLFISPRTVEYHLGKVFTKLGISSRRELRSIGAQLDLDDAPH